jgi:DNA-binding MarR family transcriptional regulator
VSHQDSLDPFKTASAPSNSPLDDGLLQADLRLGLDEVAAIEEEKLRANAPEPPSNYELVRLASRIYEARRCRDRLFEQRLFGEPAWDMLLALYCFPSQGKLLGVMSLGHAANVPPTTGLGWQKRLEEEGLIERGPCVSDSRQQLVGLTEKGRLVMSKYLTRLFHCEGAAAIDRNSGES